MDGPQEADQDEPARPHRRRRPTPTRDGWLPALVVTLLACGHVIAAPFVINQNQYLVHVEGRRVPALASDWLVGTTDPYPFFTMIMGAVSDAGGVWGIRLVAFLGTLVAVSGVYRLARLFTPYPSRGIPLLATVMVSATLVVVPAGLFVFSGSFMSAFTGFAGQYLLSTPGYAQPSLAGALLLLACAMWFEHLLAPQRSSPRRLVVAGALAVVACMVHPIYMAVTLVGLAAALGADIMTRPGRRLRRLVRYVVVGSVVVGATMAANPMLLDLAAAASSDSEALDRFAFRRIPHHTLVGAWPEEDVWRLALIVVAIALTSRIAATRWLSWWLGLALSVAAVSAVVVALTKWQALALLFPWRISVLLVPVSAAVVATWSAARLAPLARRHWRRDLVLVSTAFAAVGLSGTIASTSPAVSDEGTALVRSTRPAGVGLIPLEAENVRLNAGVPVYVDWKSAPYTGEDLEEWWRRVDRVRALRDDVGEFCTASWTDGIDWVLQDITGPAPSCVSGWTELGRSGRWAVFSRP